MKKGVLFDLNVECFIDQQGDAQIHILELPWCWSRRQSRGFINLSCEVEPLFKKQFSISVDDSAFEGETDDPFAALDELSAETKTVDPEIEELSFSKAMARRVARRGITGPGFEGYGKNTTSRHNLGKVKDGVFPERKYKPKKEEKPKEADYKHLSREAAIFVGEYEQ